jgi:hypothetical protein
MIGNSEKQAPAMIGEKSISLIDRNSVSPAAVLENYPFLTLGIR